jgi:O-acetyl-ADP-ribose deacetylase (regulator of RNase III)
MPFKIIRNDITKVRASAIVNTANPMPVIGSGTDSAIYEAAGEERLLAARKKIGTIEPGKAAITRGYGLPAAYIIHTVGPVWEGGGKQELAVLADCYRTSLALADQYRCRSIAFPLISTGNYGFPKDLALQTAIGVFTEFLADHEMEILLVVFDKDSLALSENLVGAIDSYIDERYAGVQARREYSSPFRERVFESSELHDFSAGGAIYKDDTWQSYSASLNAPDEDSFIFDDLLEEESSPEDFRLSEEREVSRPKPFPALSAPRRPEPDSAPVPDRGSRPKASESGAFRRTEKRRRTLDGLADQLGESFQKMLFRLIDEKNMTDVEVYKRANIDKRLFSKIRSNSRYQPRKSTALALAIALRLNLDETKDLLSRAGYALSPSSLSDLIVSFFIENEIWDVITIDIALFEHDETPLTG